MAVLKFCLWSVSFLRWLLITEQTNQARVADMYNPFPADPSRRGRGPTPDTPSNEPEPPLPLRLRVRKWRQNAGATLAGVPRALPLVWKSHRGYTVGMA